MENAKGAKLSKEAVARLVASRERAQNEERSLGFESGKRWAEQEAEWSELRDLANETEKGGDARYVIRTVYSDDLTDDEIENWLQGELGELYSDDILEAFIEGAVSVYGIL